MRRAGTLPRFPAPVLKAGARISSAGRGTHGRTHAFRTCRARRADGLRRRTERTFASFVTLTKITTLACIAILQALALFGFANGGFWLGVLLIVLMMVARPSGSSAKGTVKPLVGVVILGFILMALPLG